MHVPGPNYKWHVVAMLWCISFFNYADRQAIFAVLPLLSVQMSLDKVEQGLLGSSFAWVYGLAAPFAGLVVDRVRRKTAILAGLHAWSLICMVTAASRNFGHLLFFRAAEGLGETFYYPASVALLSDYHSRRTRSRALGLHQTSVYVGTIGGSYFAGLIGESYGWQASFVVFGALGMVLGVLLQYSLIEPARGAADQAESGAKVADLAERRLSFQEVVHLIARTPTLLLLMLAFMCAIFVTMVLLTWMPTYLKEKFDYSLSTAGLTATVFAQLGSMAGASLGGWLADAWRASSLGGRIWVQVLGVLGGAPCMFLCGWLHSELGIWLALGAWGLFKGLYDANIFAAAFEVVPDRARGTVAGFMNMMGWLGGGATAPVLIGCIGKHYGLEVAISSAAGVYVAAGVLLLLGGLVFLRGDYERVQKA
jgi:sugar phosphate permease